jgi:hypothetical protein
MSSISAWGGGLPPHPGPKQGTLFIPMTGSQGPSSDLRGKKNDSKVANVDKYVDKCSNLWITSKRFSHPSISTKIAVSSV